MIQVLKLNRLVISLGLPVLMLLFCIFFSQTSIFTTNSSTFSSAITFDLIITTPLVYFLLIRKTKIPNITIAPFIIVGAVIGSIILPQQNQHYLEVFKQWGLPLVELTVLFYIGYKVRKAIATYHIQKEQATDFYLVLLKTCNEVLPKGVANVVSTEIAIIYYGFIDWNTSIPKDNEFTYHKKSGTIAILGVVMFVAAVEIFVLHILIVRWNVTVAWVLSGLSMYAAIQLFGILKSIPRRLITINNTQLIVRYGIWREAEIRLEDIESIILTKKDMNKKDKLAVHLSPFSDLEGHNVVIHLKYESLLRGLYGYNKKFRTLALNIDAKDSFKQNIESKMKVAHNFTAR